MDDLNSPAGLPLWSDHVRFMRRHRRLIGALMGIGVSVGLCWSLAQPSTFSATASVALAPVPVYVMPTTDELVPPEVSIDTDAQLLQSPTVMEAIGDALGTNEVDARDHLSVTASPFTRVLHVSITAKDPADAATAANDAVEALIDVRRRSLASLSANQMRRLRFLVTSQNRVLAQEQAQRLVIPARDEVFGQVLDFRARLDELKGARRAPGEVISPARAPDTTDYANTEVALTSGAMLGLLAGWLLGVARDRSTRTPTHAEEHDDVA